MLNIFNKPANNGMQKFRRTYNFTDFGMTANVSVPASTWTKIGSLTVGAQQQVTFGCNDPTGGSSIAGAPVYLRVDCDNPTSQLQGKIRFSLSNANETNEIVVMEESTQRLSASSTGDRTIAVLLPEYPARAGQDSKLKILMYSTSAVTIDYDGTSTSASIPVTVYY